MNDPPLHPLELILRRCAEAAPAPWYPSAFARERGISRDSLDPHLDQLRLGGLIRLTDWVQGHGQGYALTPEGAEVVQNPRLLARLKDGRLPLGTNGLAARQSPAEGTPAFGDRAEAVRTALLEPSIPRVTLALLFINILWFFVGLGLAVHEGLPANLYLWGGAERNEDAFRYSEVLRLLGNMNGSDFYLRSQWWRLFTCAFVHIGLIHLGVNMLSLYWVGPLLERMWGHGRFLILYLLALVGGSCGMLFSDPVHGSAGASGALWGIMASMATWLYLNRRVLPPGLVSTWAQQLLMVFVLNVFITFSVANISKGGHFGGGLAGLMAAVPLHYLRFGRPGQRVLAFVGLFALPLLCVAALAYFLAGKGGEEIRAFSARFDAALWEGYFGPKVDHVADLAGAVYDKQVKPLLERHPDRRDPAEIEKTVASLARVKTQVDGLSRLLQEAGPFYTARYREARRTALDYLDACSTVLQLAQEALPPSDSAAAKEKLLQQQVEHMDKALKSWERFSPAKDKEQRKDDGDGFPPLAVTSGRSHPAERP